MTSALAVLAVVSPVVARDCNDPDWQGEPLRRIAVAVAEVASLDRATARGDLATGYSALALNLLRGQLTQALVRPGADGASACTVTLAAEARLDVVRRIGGGPPAPLRDGWTAATCDDPARVGDLWATMLPDIDAARAGGILSDETHRGFSVAFTAVSARISSMDAAPLPEVCRAFLGLWMIWRS